jgi:hypothetical protein
VLRARIRTNQDVLRASCEITRFSAADVERVFAEGGDNNNDATMAVDVGREDEGDGGDGAAAVIQRMAPAMREEMRRRVLAGVPLTAAESSRLATRLQKLDADHARRVGHLIMEETRLLGSSSSSSSYDDDDYYHHHHHDHHRDDEHGGIPPSKRLKSSYNHEGGIGDIQVCFFLRPRKSIESSPITDAAAAAATTTITRESRGGRESKRGGLSGVAGLCGGESGSRSID